MSEGIVTYASSIKIDSLFVSTIPYELGNLLLFGEEETFFNNSKFAVENSEFRIRATACEQDEI